MASASEPHKPETLTFPEYPTGNGGAYSATPSPTEPTSPPTVAVFDPELAMKRCFDQRDMLKEMIACFFKDADSLLPQIRIALQKGDLMRVERLAHRLKGTLVYLGAEAAREAASRTERFVLHAGEQAETEEAVRALERECEVLRAALTEYRATTSPRQGGK
jgi:HPt (histidine-containing phosphotransfer) domain-containing protein